MTMSKPAMNHIRLLIFDLDGTLIDSKTDLVLSVNAMREQMGLPRLDTAVVVSYVGRGIATLIRRALGEGASHEEVEQATVRSSSITTVVICSITLSLILGSAKRSMS